MIKYFITPNVLMVDIKGQHLFAPKTHPNYEKICKVLKQGSQDENEIKNLFDIKRCILSEFSDYIEIDDKGRLFLKYCHQIDMEKFAKEALVRNNNGECINGFFSLLINMNQNKTIETYQFLQWLKKKKMSYSSLGLIKCYAKVWNSGEVSIEERRADAIIFVHPKELKFYSKNGEMTLSNENLENEKVLIKWQGNTSDVPNLEGFENMDGDDLLSFV